MPTVAQVQGAAVAEGGATSRSAVVSWSWLTTRGSGNGFGAAPRPAMWAYRVGVERAKRMLFTGDLISGTEAAAMGLVLQAVPRAKLDEAVQLVTDRISSVPVRSALDAETGHQWHC